MYFCWLQTDELFLGLLVWHKHLNYPQGKKQPRDSDADSTGCHSQYTTRSGASSLFTSTSMLSSLCTDSSIGSVDSSSSSFSSNSRDDDCSKCEVESDVECDSDYYSCIDDADHHYSKSDLQQEPEVSTSSSSSGDKGAVQQPVYRPFAASAAGQQQPLLEMAFSAPADLVYLSMTYQSLRSSEVPSGTTVDAGATTSGHAEGCTEAGGEGANKRGKAKRKSAGGKALAAVTSAARHMAARFKARPGLALGRNVSCPGSAL